MSEIFNVYCDESCHLEHDRQKAIVLATGLYRQSKRQRESDQ